MQVQAHFIEFMLFKKLLEDHVYDFPIGTLFCYYPNSCTHTISLQQRQGFYCGKIMLVNLYVSYLFQVRGMHAAPAMTAQKLSVCYLKIVINVGLLLAFGLHRQANKLSHTWKLFTSCEVVQPMVGIVQT